MKFAIFLQNYFPYGGLQRDALRLAQAANHAGDDATIIVSTWSGPKPTQIKTIALNSGGNSNHAKASRFSSACQNILATSEYDTAISFSRVAGAPFYYCGDACFLEKFIATKSQLAKILPRYRFFLDNETALFGKESSTHPFFLSQQEADSYQRHYPISKDNFTILPPWLSPPLSCPESPKQIRQTIFKNLGLSESDQLLLFVGSNYQLKRLDVLIRSLAGLANHIHLAVCGRDSLTPPRKLAQSLGLGHRVHLMGACDDIPQWMMAADLLVHPSKRETAGMVLIEALSYGLPVTCTELCGYANYVKEAGGSLLSNHCTASEISTTVTQMLMHLPELQEKAFTWASTPALYQTADIILNSMRDSLS